MKELFAIKTMLDALDISIDDLSPEQLLNVVISIKNNAREAVRLCKEIYP